jgi:hypothetical protein
MSNLVEFKLFICIILLNKKVSAQQELDGTEKSGTQSIICTRGEHYASVSFH